MCPAPSAASRTDSFSSARPDDKCVLYYIDYMLQYRKVHKSNLMYYKKNTKDKTYHLRWLVALAVSSFGTAHPMILADTTTEIIL